MSESFEQMMSGEFGDDFGQSAVSGALTPDKADDHVAIHVLEGLLQVAACLDVLEYAIPFVTDKAYPLLAEFGLGAFMDAALGDPRPERHSPEMIAFMGSVRSMATDLALACEQYLREHGIPRIIFMVHLDGHGWNPMVISSGLDPEE